MSESQASAASAQIVFRACAVARRRCCAKRATDVLALAALLAVTSANAQQSCPFDNGDATLTKEGLILSRYALGITGAPLVANTGIPAASAQTVEDSINSPAWGLNITGNTDVNGAPVLTVNDATIISRKIAGFNGPALTNGLALSGPRNTPTAVQNFLLAGCPGTGWIQGGNSFGAPGVIGTNDAQPLTVRSGSGFIQMVNATNDGLRIEDNTDTTFNAPNVINGLAGNAVGSSVYGATISGGGFRDLLNSPNNRPQVVLGNYGAIGGGLGSTASGFASTIAGGDRNMASAHWASVGGGEANTASGQRATVGGGLTNTAAGTASTVGGGVFNAASTNYTTIGGGDNNTASAARATVGGGSFNVVSGQHSTISGGSTNAASGLSNVIAGGSRNQSSDDSSAVGGGLDNNASAYVSVVGGGQLNAASGSRSVVGGGSNNTASGYAATVVGGVGNTAAGDFSVAMGLRAKSLGNGSFHFADSNAFDFSASTVNAFRVRATGGVRFVTDIDSSTGAITWSCAAFAGASWSCSSDRNLKHSLKKLDGRKVLAKLAAMPVYQWQPKGQNTHVKHVGPMAQDFMKAFGVGDDDKMIGMQDADGVALAAIQGLNQIVKAKDAKIAALEKANAVMQREMAAIKRRLGM